MSFSARPSLTRRPRAEKYDGETTRNAAWTMTGVAEPWRGGSVKARIISDPLSGSTLVIPTARTPGTWRTRSASVPTSVALRSAE